MKSNWKNEIQKHSNLSCRILGEKPDKKGRLRIGSVKERVEQLKNPIDEFFVITNIETIRDDNIIKYLNKGPNVFDMIVVDEIHTCFSGDTLVTTESGEIAIKDLCEMDNKPKVLSLSKDFQKQYKQITGVSKFAQKTPILRLEILDDEGIVHELKCTKNHKILTHNRGFVEAQYLTEEDDVVFNS